MKKLTTSVIIPTRNRKFDILRCLKSLKQQTLLPDQIVIIDSSDTHLNIDPEFINFFNTDQFPKTDCVYLSTERGSAYQRNRGIERATGDIFFFFDDDVALKPDYLNVMVNTFIEHPYYGGGMSDISNIKSYRFNFIRLFRLFFMLDRNHADGRFTFSGMPTHAYGNTQFSEIEVLGGCCMAIRGDLIKNLMFDEKLRFYSYMEDCDVSLRLSQTHKLFFQPRTSLVHYESPVSRDRLFDNRAMYIANYSYLFFKNFYPQARWKILFYYWSVCGLLLEGILRADSRVFFGYLAGLGHVLRTRAKQPYCNST